MQQNIKTTGHKPRVESTPCKRVGMTVVGVVVRAYRVPTRLVRFEIQFVQTWCRRHKSKCRYSAVVQGSAQGPLIGMKELRPIVNKMIDFLAA